MIRVPADSVEGRLNAWRERWRLAPTADARAHAQAAIDHWLDRLLELEVGRGGRLVPTQRATIDHANSKGT